MSRDEFMKQLEQLLADVSEEEKKEALEYYRGYFEDAGEENEERIIRELESPEKVAKTIKADLGISDESVHGEYTAAGHQDSRFEEEQEQKVPENSGKPWRILLIVAAVIITSPFWVALAAALFGGAAGVLGTVLGLLVAGVAVAGALYIAGAAVFGVGIVQLVTGSAAAGLALLGSGMLLLAFAVLTTIACVWIYGKFIPWVIRGIIKLCKSAFSGRGKAA